MILVFFFPIVLIARQPRKTVGCEEEKKPYQKNVHAVHETCTGFFFRPLSPR